MTLRKSVLLLLLTAIIAANAAYFWLSSNLAGHEQDTTQPTASNKGPEIVPPPIELLGQGKRMPTPEELEDESRYNDQAVIRAGESLHDPAAEKRVGAVEQLSAYPTPESEQILINTLSLDFDPEVRRAAAQSLAVFKQPTKKTVTALLTALQDDSVAVQMEAMNTLIRIASKLENGSEPLQTLLANLSNQAKAKRMKPEVRTVLRSFLQDQQPLSLSFP